MSDSPPDTDPGRGHGTASGADDSLGRSWRLRGRILVDGRVADVTVSVEGDHFGPVGPDGSGSGPTVSLPADHLVVPGYVDLQCNGGWGLDLATDPNNMWELAGRLPATGVTAFLPTIISAEADVYDRALAALADRPADHRGAEPLGLHFEGPMLAPTKRGAHTEAHLRPPDPDLHRSWSREAGVALVTLAPELPGALDTIAALVDAGIVVSGGHTNADADTAAEATAAGMSMVTHLFNAMAPLGHRSPNLVGHALTSDRLSVGLIVDGVHLDPMVVDLTLRAVGPERLILVTDAVAAMGRPDGTYGLGDRRIVAGPDGVRRPDGTLAGSALTMDRAVANLVDFTGCDTAVAVGCASTGPARLVGEHGRGRIETGARADFTVLDTDLRPVATVVGGRTVFGRLEAD